MSFHWRRRVCRITDFFVDPSGNPSLYDPRFPNDSYFLQTFSEDKQTGVGSQGKYSFTDQLKATLGARYSLTKFPSAP